MRERGKGLSLKIDKCILSSRARTKKELCINCMSFASCNENHSISILRKGGTLVLFLVAQEGKM